MTNQIQPTISAIIPTFNAAKWLPAQLQALHTQSIALTEIIIVDSQSEDNTCEIAVADPLCRLIRIQRSEFDHGGTRDTAARSCQSDYLWFLTQDAIPVDTQCLQALLNAMQDDSVACAYGCQLASKSASRIEQLTRQFNYPLHSFTRSAKDIPTLQVRAFFLSDTCCLYKRDAYLACGGFCHYLPTNEDMLMAAAFLKEGYQTAYCAEAEVWHSHSMTLGSWYKRCFDIGAFMEMYKKRLYGVQARGEGKKYVITIIGQLFHEGRIISIFRFLSICIARLLGDCAGHRYTRFSPRNILRRTNNPMFWQRYLNDHSAVYTYDE